MEDILAIIIVIPTIFVGLPWLILHYITKWKIGASTAGPVAAATVGRYATASQPSPT